jgi:hypothetical protein
MKRLNLLALMMSMIIGLLIAGPVGAIAGAGISLIPQGGGKSLKAGLFPEIWTGEMVKAFRHDDAATFLNVIKDYSQYAQNDVIHLVDVGADPDVLVNNTTYPIPIQDLPDQDIAISLNKFQTKATRITDDELNAIKHDKMQSVIERHKAKITEEKHDMAIHALAPQSHSTVTPIVATSGVVDTTEGRQKVTRKDLIRLKKAFDKLKVPVMGRILVLCEDHVNDILEFDQKFRDQYYNYESGKISNLYSFAVYSYVNNPYFNGTTLSKKAYGSATIEGTDFQGSVAYYAPRMFKATGSTKTYMSAAKDNPTTQENLINFRHYFITLPKKQEAIGALVSTAADGEIIPDPVPEVYNVTFTVEDEAQAPVVGAELTIEGGDLENPVILGTGDNGTHTTPLSDGLYSYSVAKVGFIAQNDILFEVNGADIILPTVTLVAQT